VPVRTAGCVASPIQRKLPAWPIPRVVTLCNNRWRVCARARRSCVRACASWRMPVMPVMPEMPRPEVRH